MFSLTVDNVSLGKIYWSPFSLTSIPNCEYHFFSLSSCGCIGAIISLLLPVLELSAGI